MYRDHNTFLKRVAMTAFLCANAASALAVDVHAEGFNVLQASFPTQGEVWNVSIAFSLDGETFRSIGAGLPRQENLFRSVLYGDKETVVLVAVAGSYGMGESAFVFQDPGRCQLRWRITLRDPDKPRTVPDQMDRSIEPLVIEQTVDVLPARAADVAFVERLSDPDILRRLLGEDFFDRQPEEYRERLLSSEGRDQRALTVIAELLKATRELWAPDVVGDRSGEAGIRVWGDALRALVEDLPESSYAPYAAYYAGCCYSVISLNKAIEEVRAKRVPGKRKDRLDEVRQRGVLLTADPDFEQARKMFELVSKDGDTYSRPLGIYQSGFLHLMAREWGDAERFFQTVLETAPGHATLSARIDELRAEMRKLGVGMAGGE